MAGMEATDMTETRLFSLCSLNVAAGSRSPKDLWIGFPPILSAVSPEIFAAALHDSPWEGPYELLTW
ncbi:hypothetical protein GGR39_003072 [Novosphingobium fluoreni]|uniref:Uncharacterized protein n=1 Tax=Novosphingobium fluoreni TaxID=1391222 RepID=A0A7W6C6E0_9SPHN|nr:hypothetical protein [Novosphingobium fluoreni]